MTGVQTCALPISDQNGNNGQFAGLKDQIINYGGSHQIMQQAPNEAEIKKTIEYIRQSKGSGTEISFFAGTLAYGAIQTSLGDKFIPYAGDTNTIGGKSVKGIDIQTYKWMDCTIKFVPFNDFNNLGWYNQISTITNTVKQQNAYFAFDTSMVEASNGEALPFMSNYIYGSEDETEKV